MHFLKKYKYFLLAVFIPAIFFFSLPHSMFDDPTSTIIYDRNGKLAGARIAEDGQWRFPMPDSVPDIYKNAVLAFEDQYFHYHPGVNPLAIFRAVLQNIKAGEIVSGGSTLNMQVIRLSRKGKSRTILEKLVESILAVRLELAYTKEEIFRLYAGHAPFGGNVVGIEAASWRYFNRDPFNLSVAEAATLAVLPNAPSLIHPGRNRQALIRKRNRLLAKMYEKNIIDSLTWQTALIEELPDQPSDLPQLCYHLTEKFYITDRGKAIHSTIDPDLQHSVNSIIETRKEILYANQIHNAAALILDTESGEILSYYGNIRNRSHPEYGGDVDIITSPRSTGSILKPILYAEMLYRGDILPNTLINDIPTRYRAYSPKNYNRTYDGVVPANEALSRSLNVPAVRMLDQYGLERFHHNLRELGLKSVKYPAGHYGLSLILGGAETTLWELAGLYSGMARVLNHYIEGNGNYFRSDWHDPVLQIQKNNKDGISDLGIIPEEQGKLGAGAIWLTFEALREVKRPDIESGWKFFDSSRKVAWKTGTSFGFRDGWAIGTTPEYVVAVWVGNANGEGRPGLTGLNAAAPVLFDLLNILPETSWFKTPYDDLVRTEVCKESGYKAGMHCTEKDSLFVTPAGLHTHGCPYHKLIHLNEENTYRVNADCYEAASIRHEPWFILPPVQEWYYIRSHPGYAKLPPLLPGCEESREIEQIQLIYPDPGSVIYVPREMTGEKGRVVFEAKHREEGKSIFWSIDENFIGQTRNYHQIAVDPDEGKHTLLLTDEDGYELKTVFEVID